MFDALIMVQIKCTVTHGKEFQLSEYRAIPEKDDNYPGSYCVNNVDVVVPPEMTYAEFRKTMNKSWTKLYQNFRMTQPMYDELYKWEMNSNESLGDIKGPDGQVVWDHKRTPVVDGEHTLNMRTIPPNGLEYLCAMCVVS